MNGYLANSLTSMRNALHRTYIPMLDKESFAACSLNKMFETRMLSVASRRKLAADLALRMLRFHGTGWLPTQWGRREIRLLSTNGPFGLGIRSYRLI